MIPLFSYMPETLAPVSLPPRWPYLRQGLVNNLERVKTYCRLYPQAVPGEHFLVKLLAAVTTPIELSLEHFYDQVDGLAKNVSMALQMTGSHYRGKVHDGIFYGAGCAEVLLLDEEYFDYYWVHDHWQDACPIKVIQHPKSDLRMLVANGKSYSEEKGLVVVTINIAMLAVMYRAFLLQRQRRAVPHSPYQFIGGFVLPNMLATHLDIALMNRYRLHAAGLRVPAGSRAQPYAGPNRRHSFQMLNYDSFAKECVEWVIDNVKRKHLNFYQTLRNLPAFSQPDMAEALKMPSIYPTTQVDWALQASRLQAVRFLLDVCAPTAQATDRGTLIRIARAYALNNTANMMEIMLPQELAQGALEDMNYILSRI